MNKQGHENYKENIGTKLITNTKKQKLKIQSRVWNFKNTMLKKEEEKERERKTKQTNKNKQSCINYKENTATKLITNSKLYSRFLIYAFWYLLSILYLHFLYNLCDFICSCLLPFFSLFLSLLLLNNIVYLKFQTLLQIFNLCFLVLVINFVPVFSL